MSKIIIFTAHYPYNRGEEYFVEEIKYLSQKFDKIIVVSSEKDVEKEKRIIPENVEVIILNRNSFKTKSILLGLIKFISFKTIKEIIFAKKVLKYKISFKALKMILLYEIVSTRQNIWIKKNIDKDEMIILYSYWLATSAYSLSLFKKNGYKFRAISRAHGYDAFLDRGYLPFRREIYSYLDEIYFISNNAKIQFEEKLSPYSFNKKAKLYTSYLGIENKNNISNPYSDDIDTFQLVSCSNIYPLKRIDIIVDALTMLDKFKVNWIHFGDGPQKNEIEYKASQQLKDKNVTFDFRGHVSNEQIKEHYKTNQVDIFINTSNYEGIPVSIMEAMSHGVPAIARDTGGINEIIIDGFNGFLLPTESNSNNLKEIMIKFFNLSVEKKRLLRFNSQKFWQEHFCSSKNYRNFSDNIMTNKKL